MTNRFDEDAWEAEYDRTHDDPNVKDGLKLWDEINFIEICPSDESVYTIRSYTRVNPWPLTASILIEHIQSPSYYRSSKKLIFYRRKNRKHEKRNRTKTLPRPGVTTDSRRIPNSEIWCACWKMKFLLVGRRWYKLQVGFIGWDLVKSYWNFQQKLPGV